MIVAAATVGIYIVNNELNKSRTPTGATQTPNSTQTTTDFIPPVTTLYVETPSYGVDPIFIKSTTKLTLMASDVGSGLKQTQYRVDSQDWRVYYDSFTIGTKGSHTVYYRSIDYAGNTENEHSKTVFVDDSPPMIITISPGQYEETSNMPTISATYTDAEVGTDRDSLVVKLDDSQISVSRSGDSFTYQSSQLSGGLHTVTINLRDLLGNVLEYTLNFYVLSPPSIEVVWQTDGTQYLGYSYDAIVQIRNTGGRANISAELSGPELVSFDGTITPSSSSASLSDSYGDGNYKIIKLTGYCDDLGKIRYNLRVTASNPSGSDSKYYSLNIELKQKPITVLYDATEYNYVKSQPMQVAAIIGQTYLGGFLKSDRTIYSDNPLMIPYYTSVAWFVQPNSESVKLMANQLFLRHSDRTLVAKEIFYFVRDYIDYDHEKLRQGEGTTINLNGRVIPLYSLYSRKAWDQFPVITLATQKGVCVDKAILLASLYEATGYDACIVTCGVQSPSDHAFVLLHLSYPGSHLSLSGTIKGVDWGDWLALDPTDEQASFGGRAFSSYATINGVVDVP
ncbi:MAG: OmpL47-type beta-barrel domain-containing protein [Candidatus Methanomethylicaceae archaeon]